jgi:tripartite-type tricarboxylate transporter receptor subunit TctC
VRTIGAKLTESTGQAVVIDNRPGANGIVAGSIASKTPADGYTVLLDTNNMVLNDVLRKNLPFDALKDFVPVVRPAWVTHVIAVNPKSSKSIGNLDQLIAVMKAQPGRISYGSFGSGSTAHMAGELFDSMAGTKGLHVPYKGGAPAIVALLGNEVDVVYGTLPLVLPYLKSGQLRAVAVTSLQRVAALPDVPTVAERLPNYNVDLWWAFFVPSNTSKAIVTLLNREILAALSSAESRQKLSPLGYNLTSSTPEQVIEALRVEKNKWENLVKSTNIKLD